MRKATDLIPGVALFLAGMAAGVLSSSSKPTDQEAKPEHTGDLEARVAAQEAAAAERFSRIEACLEEHSVRLAEAPTTSQIVSVMEQLLSKTVTSLDERLAAQAHSIEVLKTTVSQTDSLLERVLESLDSLESYSESSESGEDALFTPAV